MRFRAFSPAAYGHFHDLHLDFGEGRPDFHIIRGDNESGKTTALEALRDFLFGIDSRSDYDFLHGYAGMRIEARVQIDSKEHHLRRLKRNKDPLVDADSDEPVPESLLQSCLGYLRRDEFCRMFGLGHGDLEAGGRAIAEGQGQVGDALFAAGMGIANLGAVRTRIEARAGQFYKPRASNPSINAKLSEIDKARRTVRESQVSSTAWTNAQEALTQARSGLDEMNEQMSGLQVEARLLGRLSHTIPALARRAELALQLADLGDVPSLPPDFDDRRESALKSGAGARQTLDEARSRLAANAAETEKIVLPAELLQRAGEIDLLREGAGSHAKAQKDRPDLESKLHAAEAAVAQILEGLPGRPDRDAARRMTPDTVATGRIRNLASDRAGHDVRVSTSSAELARAERDLAKAREAVAALPEPRDGEALERELRAARGRGELDQAVSDKREAVADRERSASARLAQLGRWSGELPEVLALPVPLAETVRRFTRDLRALDDADARVRAETTRADESEAAHVEALRALETAGAVPLETDLMAARERRDAGWDIVKRRYVGREDTTAAEAAYAGGGDLVRAYEAAIRGADDVADRLRRESDRVAARAQHEAQVTRVRGDRERLTREQQELADKREGMEADWRAEWAPRHIEPGTPDEMTEWLTKLEDLRAQVDELGTLRTELGRVDGEREALIGAMSAELGLARGRPAAAGRTLARLLDQADAELKAIRGEVADRERLEGELVRRSRDVEERQDACGQAVTAFEQWRVAYAAAVDCLGLGDVPATEDVESVLKALEEVRAKEGEAHGLRKRIEDIHADARRFSGDVARLAEELAPDLLDLAPDDASRELQRRLEAAQRADARRDELQGRIDEDTATVERGERDLAAAEAELRELCSMARCDHIEGLKETWARCQKADQLRGSIAEIESDLSARAAGGSVRAVAEEAEGRNLEEVKAQLAALQVRLAELEEADRALREELGERRRIAAEMTSADTAAQLEECRQAIAASLRDDVEEYLAARLALHILDSALERYRKENEGELLREASRLFAELTLHRFSGLGIGFGKKDEAVLQGVRGGTGARIGVEGMSDGTRDQLYLALRLAHIRQHLASRPPIPFIVDDVLIRFDDARSRAALRTLGELARSTQVLFFTHHERLAELALEELGEDGCRVIRL